MSEKIVIIIPNEKLIRIPVFKYKCREIPERCIKEYHEDGVRKFIQMHDINLYGKENSMFQEMAYELIEQGYCVIAYDASCYGKTASVFLPQKVSPKQLEHFELEKENLNTYNILLYFLNELNLIDAKDKNRVNGSIVDYLMNELQNRLQTNNKTKQLVKPEALD